MAMFDDVPELSVGDVSLRPIQKRDARDLERLLAENRDWLAPWQATSPTGLVGGSAKDNIRELLDQARAGAGVPFVMRYRGQFAGQLNLFGITRGSLQSASIGYWVAREFAGMGITPTAVASASDFCFRTLGIHRVEICIRPENAASLRVVEKLGFRYEGLRPSYIHINGKWADHFAFALVREEVPLGVLHRWDSGQVPISATTIPDADWAVTRLRRREDDASKTFREDAPF